jgi:hypothetical protein
VSGDLLRFVALLAPAKSVSGGGFWSSSAWYTIWNGRGWLNARKLTADQAQDWHVVQLEAMGGRQPLGNIQLWKWNGNAWQRAS